MGKGLNADSRSHKKNPCLVLRLYEQEFVNSVVHFCCRSEPLVRWACVKCLTLWSYVVCADVDLAQELGDLDLG